MEDIPAVERKSSAHEACESLFAEHRRALDGKYIVRLPLLARGPEQLGDSESNARASLASLHRRMRRDHRFAAEYRRFMEEYLSLGHMRLVPEHALQAVEGRRYYIPHKGIWQHSDSGEELRVVFNASWPTTSGKSLNDVVHPGPKLQTDIWLVLIRWRTHRVAFCADIQMMFRQIWIDEQDVDLQRILWSPRAEEPVRHYQLLTVTYGTACAPYLSLRVLEQLCADEREKFPAAAAAALRDRYVDDILSGAHELEEALRLRNEFIQLMGAGGFPLRKWVSNRPELLEDLDPSHCLRTSWVQFTADHHVRELGIAWNPQEDVLGIRAPAFSADQRSKRAILAALASIYDPCGWLAPVILVMKLLLQDLWRAKLHWDDELPNSMRTRWDMICKDTSALSEVSIARWISAKHTSDDTRIHAFADASRRAMAAVLYSRTTVNPAENTVNLLAAKTKLAPIRSLRPTTKPLPRMTIPRLELRAARQLLNESCWFQGPEWLASVPLQWPPDHRAVQPSSCDKPTRVVLAVLAEKKGAICRAAHLSAFSNLGRLLRFLVRLRRWIRLKLNCQPMLKVLDPLTPSELDTTLEACIRVCKRSSFSDEIDFLERQQQTSKPEPLPCKSSLRSLNPFVCSNGILRVGGRLTHSALPYNQKHPPILDGSCDLARLIIDWAHTRSIHGGFRSTYSYALQKAWLIGGKRHVRRFIHRCVTCARARAAPLTQIMAALPAARVTPSRAFASTGLDYAGPFHVLSAKGRGIRTTKAYVAVFVCMGVNGAKAIHLELACDLTTESLNGVLDSFCARRGCPAEFWSDNATNFHRADVEMREALNQESLQWDKIQNHLAERGISWKFIPPAAPHFGGLWEAGVRSFKVHLKKVIRAKHLTYEEFTTLLAGIELVLNCRPFGPISGDPDDLAACTPGHLLVGDSLRSIPQLPADADRVDRLQHWKLVQGLRAKFWQQWSREYLNTLQQRCKWTRRFNNTQVGDFVLILDASLLRSDGRWPLGRVTEVHPGRDGLVRSATVKTQCGVYVRPIVKLAALPVAETPSEETPSASNLSSRPRRAGITYQVPQGGQGPPKG